MGTTIKDVAKAAGVSIATVSKYINGGNLREKYRLSVEQAVAELDYSVNAVARNLKIKRTSMIGVMVPALSTSYNANLAAAIQCALAGSGYTALILDFQLNKKSEERQLDVLIRWHVDGIILVPCFNEKHILDKAVEKGIPVVLADSLIYGAENDAIVTNNYDSTYEVVAHMLANNHKHIAALIGRDSSYTASERARGYKDAMSAYGFEPISAEALYMKDKAYECTKDLMMRKVRPTALLSTNYNMTMGMLAALREMQIRIPDDVSVAVFDELEQNFALSTPLTTIMQPADDIGRAAVDMLIEKIQGKAENAVPGLKVIKNRISYTDSIKRL